MCSSACIYICVYRIVCMCVWCVCVVYTVYRVNIFVTDICQTIGKNDQLLKIKLNVSYRLYLN